MTGQLQVPRVKVCGLRRLEEVEAAVAAGADAIGLVAVPRSVRCIEALAARELVRALPPGVRSIAVFVDASPAEVAIWLEESGASAVQLCGSEEIQQWIGFQVPILRRVAVREGAHEELERWRGIASGFVLDHPSSAGGSGALVDVELAHALCARAPCVLAGGLDATNVAERIRRVVPRGVDASSRLENFPGRKDQAQIRNFVLAARAAFAEYQP